MSVDVKYLYHAFPVCELSHIKRQRSSRLVRYCAEPGCGVRLAQLNTGPYCYRHDALHADEELAMELASFVPEPVVELTIPPETTGKELKAIILGCGVSVADAARAIGLNPSTLYSYTQGAEKKACYKHLPEKYRRALAGWLSGEEVTHGR